MRDPSYQERPPIVVDTRAIRRTIETLRPTSQPVRCFWCSRPLDGGICPACDR